MLFGNAGGGNDASAKKMGTSMQLRMWRVGVAYLKPNMAGFGLRSRGLL